MDVPVGTSVEELIERAGGIDGVYGEIIMGGPFTGKATTFDAPITKTTGGIIVTMEFLIFTEQQSDFLSVRAVETKRVCVISQKR